MGAPGGRAGSRRRRGRRMRGGALAGPARPRASALPPGPRIARNGQRIGNGGAGCRVRLLVGFWRDAGRFCGTSRAEPRETRGDAVGAIRVRRASYAEPVVGPNEGLICFDLSTPFKEFPHVLVSGMKKLVVGAVDMWARGTRVWAGGGQRASVVHGLSTRPEGRAPVR